MSLANVGIGTSSGYAFDTDVDVDVGVSINPLVGVTLTDVANATVDLGPLAGTSGTAPAPYNSSSGPQAIGDVGANAGVDLLGIELGVQTTDFAGVLNSTSQSDVDAASGTRTSTGSSIVTGLDLRVGSVNATVLVPVISLPLLQITSSTVSSTSSVTGNGNGVSVFTPTVTNLVEDFTIRILGLDVTDSLLTGEVQGNLAIGAAVDVTVDLSVALTASIFNSVGDIVDNSAVVTGTLRISNQGVTSGSTVEGSAEGYALRIELTNVGIGADLDLDVLGLQVADADTDISGIITVAGSSAYEAIPEPNAAMLALLGGGTLIFWRRRFQG